jgi:hypothetical protein
MKRPLIEALVYLRENRVDFSELFSDIKTYVNYKTDANVTQKFVLGILSQLHEFDQYDKRLKDLTNFITANPDNEQAKARKADISNRIAVRDALVDMGYVTKKENGLFKVSSPEVVSGLKAFLARPIHDTQAKPFSALDKTQQKGELRDANYAENQEWYQSLSPQHKAFIDGAKELSAEGWTKLKRVIDLQKAKREYLMTLNDYLNDGSLPPEALINMGLIKNAKIDPAAVASFSEFISSLSAPRLMSNLGKDALYAFKKITHDAALQKNNVLRAMDSEATQEGTAIRLYNEIVGSVGGRNDDAFKQALKQNDLYDSGNLTDVGRKVVALYQRLKGKKVPQNLIAQAVEAIKNYNSPKIKADRANKKAITRGATVKKLTDI